MCSHDSGEKFGQPGVSCGTQVLQEFHMDVVVTWGCRWFRLLQSSWNLLFSEWMRKTLVWHLLQKSSALHMNLVFKLRLSNDFTAAWLTFTFSQLFAVAATLKSIYYNVAITFILNNNNNNISWKGLLWCWAWPLAIAKFLVLPHHKYVCILPGKSIRWMHGVIGSSNTKPFFWKVFGLKAQDSWFSYHQDSHMTYSKAYMLYAK